MSGSDFLGRDRESRGAPTVLSLLINAPADQKRKFPHVVDIQTGGSPPPAKVIKAMEELGFRVTHIYGMTELHGPVDARRAAGSVGEPAARAARRRDGAAGRAL